MPASIQNLELFLWAAALLAGAVLSGFLLDYLLFRLAVKFFRPEAGGVRESFMLHCRRPARWLVVLLSVHIFLPTLEMTFPDNQIMGVPKQILVILLIGSIAWLLIQLTKVLEDWLGRRFRLDVQDNLASRKIHTQIRILNRIVTAVILILAFSTMLMTFEKIRQFGTTLLASAGIIGVIVGMAAQRTITTFIAGLQIAFTQPVRVDDVVIVENEWGRIEEITLTYVVIRIWDQRRLIVPVTYFIEKPFQNWTRISADLLGTVFLYVDYTVPVETIRNELHRILKTSAHWDGKVWGLQVTDTTERVMALRALMSAADASTAWNLRCEVREKLLDFIQKNYPNSLPKLRAEVSSSENRPGAKDDNALGAAGLIPMVPCNPAKG